VKANDVDKVIQAVNIKESITTALNQNSNLVRIEDDKIFYANREVTGVIASRIFEVIRLGLARELNISRRTVGRLRDKQ